MEFSVHYDVTVDKYKYKACWCKIVADTPQEAVQKAFGTKIPKKVNEMRANYQAKNRSIDFAYGVNVRFNLPEQCGACGTPYGLKHAQVYWHVTKEELAALKVVIP